MEKQSLSNLNPQRQIRLKMGPVKPHEKMILIVYPDPEYRDRKRLKEQFEVSSSYNKIRIKGSVQVRIKCNRAGFLSSNRT